MAGVRAQTCFAGSVQYPKIIGATGFTEVESISVFGTGVNMKIALGIKTNDPAIVGAFNLPKAVALYDPTNEVYDWVMIIEDVAANQPIVVKFNGNGDKILAAWEVNGSQNGITFDYFDTATGSELGGPYEKQTGSSTNFDSSNIAVNSDGSSIFFIVNQSGNDRWDFCKLGFSASAFSKIACNSFTPADGNNDEDKYRASLVISPDPAESKVITLSTSESSTGGNGGNDEECTLLIWDALSPTLSNPDSLHRMKEQDDDDLKRSCRLPYVFQDGTAYWVMFVVEFFQENAAGFGRFKLKSNFETDGAGVSRKFVEFQLIFTSLYSPDFDTFYALAIDNTNSRNVLIKFYWENPASNAEVWHLVAHTGLHTDSVIFGLSGSPDNLPVTGFYVGTTSQVNSIKLCDQSDFGETPGPITLFTTTAQVGHVSKIDMDIDSCVRESKTSTPTLDYDAEPNDNSVIDDSDKDISTYGDVETFGIYAGNIRDMQSASGNTPGQWETTNQAAFQPCTKFIGASTVYTLLAPIFELDDLIDVPIGLNLYTIPFADWDITSQVCTDTYKYTFTQIVQLQGGPPPIPLEPYSVLHDDLYYPTSLSTAEVQRITMYSNNNLIVPNTYTVSVLAKLPTTQCSVKSFAVSLYDCTQSSITGAFWLTSTQDKIDIDYEIGTGLQQEDFRYVNDNSKCLDETYDIEYYVTDPASPNFNTWVLNTDGVIRFNSNLSYQLSYSGINKRQTVDIEIPETEDTDIGEQDSNLNACTYYTANPGDCGNFDDVDFIANDLCFACRGSFDVGGSLSERQYRIKISSPNRDDAANAPNNPLTIELNLTFKHRCRYVTFSPDLTIEMLEGVIGGLDEQYVDSLLIPDIPEFTHSLMADPDPIKRDCGLQEIYILEDGTHPYPFCYNDCDDNNGALDANGDDCTHYTATPSDCGLFDDGDFTSTTLCLACGGGLPGIFQGSQQTAPFQRMPLTLKASTADDSFAGDYYPKLVVRLIRYPTAIYINPLDFLTRLKPGCHTDAYSSFLWAENGLSALGQKTHILQEHSGSFFDFVEITNTLNYCDPVFILEYDSSTAASFLPLSTLMQFYDSTGSLLAMNQCEDNDNGAADSNGNSCSHYTTTPADCNLYDDGDFTSSLMCCACGREQLAHLTSTIIPSRVEITSDLVTPGEQTVPYTLKIRINSEPTNYPPENEKELTFDVLFRHPCRSAILADNGGLTTALDVAVIYFGAYNGIIDTQTINNFPYSFPAAFTSVYACGTDCVTIDETAVTPAPPSGSVSSFLTISGHDITVYSLDPAEATTYSGLTFSVQLCAWLGEPLPLTSFSFEVTVNPNCALGDFTGYTWDSYTTVQLKYLQDLTLADSIGLLSQTLFDESFGQSLQILVPHTHCNIYYHLEYKESSAATWETDLTVAAAKFIVTEPDLPLGSTIQDPVPSTPSTCLVTPTTGCGSLTPRHATVHATDITALGGLTYNFKLTAATYFPAYNGPMKQDLYFDIEWKDPCWDVTLEFLESTDTIYTTFMSAETLFVETSPTDFETPFTGANCGVVNFQLLYQGADVTTHPYLNNELQPFIYDSNTRFLTFSTTTDTPVTTYTITVKASLANYTPGGPEATYSFDIVILPCQINSISPPVDKIEPALGVIGQTLIAEFGNFIQHPACGYELEYFLEFNNATVIDDGVGITYKLHNYQNLIFVQANNTDYEDQYYIQVRASYSDTVSTADFIFDLRLFLPPVFQENNLPPEFTGDILGLEDGVVLAPFQIQFPEVVDPNGDPFVMDTFLGDLPLEISETGNLTIKEGETLAPGNYTIFITLMDGNRAMQIPFTFFVPEPIINDIPLLIPFSSTGYDPIPRIKSITSRGVVTIRWDREMVLFHESDLKQEYGRNARELVDKEHLQSFQKNYTTIVRATELQTGIIRRVEAFECYNNASLSHTVDEEMLKFDWELIEWDSREMKLQVNFNSPVVISLETPADFLEIKFWDQRPFQSQKGFYVQNQYKLRHQIPPQVEFGSATDAISALTTAVAGAVVLIGGGTMIVNVFMGAAFHLLWNMLNELMLIIHLPIFSVVFPGNTMMLYSAICQIAQFDLIETKEDPVNLVRFFDLNEEEEYYDSKFNLLEYETKNLITNFGTMFLIWSAVGLAILISFVVKFIGRWVPKAIPIYKKFNRFVYWNLILRLLVESTLELCLCGMMDLKVMNVSNWGYTLSYGLSALALLTLIAYALWIRLYLKKYPHFIKKPEFQRKFSEVYSGLDESQIQISLHQAEYYVYRRFLYAGIAFFTFNHMWQQFQLIFQSTLASIIITGMAMPYASLSVWRIELFNDWCLLGVLYHMICFTALVYEPETRYYIVGVSCIIFTIFNIVCNLSILLFQLLKKSALCVKKISKKDEHPRSLREYQLDPDYYKKRGQATDDDKIKQNIFTLPVPNQNIATPQIFDIGPLRYENTVQRSLKPSIRYNNDLALFPPPESQQNFCNLNDFFYKQHDDLSKKELRQVKKKIRVQEQEEKKIRVQEQEEKKQQDGEYRLQKDALKRAKMNDERRKNEDLQRKKPTYSPRW